MPVLLEAIRKVMPFAMAVWRLLLPCKGQELEGHWLDGRGRRHGQRRVPGKAEELCFVVSDISSFGPKGETEQEILCYGIKM